MRSTRMIQYTTKPECADENESLVAAVFAELAISAPPGFSYASYRTGDSFVHIVTQDEDDNPLRQSPAFAAFQDGIATRCLTGPTPSPAVLVGSYDAEAGPSAL
jgi:hypothetical protein